MKRTQAALQQVKLVKCICYDRISDAKIAQLHTEPQRSDKTRQLMLEGRWEWGGGENQG